MSSRSSSRRKSKGLGISIGKPFFNKSKPGELENERRPRQGDLLRLEGFGGVPVLNDAEKVTLQTLVSISVSGVVVFTLQSLSRVPTRQSKDAYQQLTTRGFGIYGLSRDTNIDLEKLNDRHNVALKCICDEEGLLIAGLGLEKSPGKDLVKGVVVIAKDGRVLLSEAECANATLEAAASFVESLDTLERTPVHEYTGEEYFARPPTSPLSPEIPGEYFAASPIVSPSTASLHTYLHSLDNAASRPTPRHSVSGSFPTPIGAPHASIAGRRPKLAPRTQTWHALASQRHEESYSEASGMDQV